MPNLVRILLSSLIGTVVCAILSFLMFFLLTVFDDLKLIEAIGYSLIVSIIGAFIGVIIGSAVGIRDLGMIGGGVAGLAVTLIVAAYYIYSSAESFSQYGRFLNASRIIFVVLTLPTILTGVITALLKNLIYKPKGRLVSPDQS
jgi:MFS family permease